MREWLVVVLMGMGSLFMLLSAVGVLRMPDLFTRMHAATKVGTVGVSGLMLAVAVHMDSLKVTAPALTIIAFFLVTAPIAAHMIGRAAYHFGVPLWKGTIIDEWHADLERKDSGKDPSAPNQTGAGI